MAKHQALYRKYRGKSLDDIIGQKHVTETLASAIKSGRISHAYLFTGPHGVGKTSVARIVAHQINDLPYKDDSGHIDIIEIDAASNRKIDEIRELKDKIHVAPTSAKYKVYIIDEVHMLTKEAFNALLKTLEEPPEHSVFILATTESHKLPATIISRSQRHSFRPIPAPIIAKHLAKLASQEKWQSQDSALELIADHAGGSLRDAIGMLDQLGSIKGKIDHKRVEDILGIAPKDAIKILLKHSESGVVSDIIKDLDQMILKGITPSSIADQLISMLRSDLEQNTLNQEHLQLIDELLGISSSIKPHVSLELALINFNLATKPTRLPKSTQEPTIDNPAPEISETKSKSAPKNSNDHQPLQSDKWENVLEGTKKQNNALHAILRMAEPTINDQTITLWFEFPFHKKRAETTTNGVLINKVIESTMGSPYQVEFATMSVKPSAKSETSKRSKAADKVIEAFGGGELVDVA